MRSTTWTIFTLVGLAALCHVGFTSPVVKRQVLENPESLDPVHQDLDSNEESDRGKRKIEGVIELTYGAKNAVLGLVFNKINSFIDQKTAWINQLDQLNVAKNRQYGIESPKDPISTFGNVFGSVLSNKLSAVGPILSLVTSKLGGASGGASGGAGGGSGGGLGGILGGLLGGLSGGGGNSDAGDDDSKENSASVSAGAGFNFSG